MIRAILFDLDDTLLDFDPARTRDAFRLGAQRTYDYLKGRGLSIPSFDRFLKAHCMLAWRMKWVARLTGKEQSVRHVLRKLCLKLRLQRDEVSLSRLGWLWYEPMVECATLAPDVAPTLIALRDAGIKLGLVCNTPLQGEVIDKHLEVEGLLDLFPVRVYSSDIGYRKPHERIFQTALDELHVPASEAIYVGDVVKTDMVGARKAGMRTVLRQRGDAIGSSEADHVIANISELLKLAPVLLVVKPQTATPRTTEQPAKLYHRV